jgi:hypothetical protein
MAEVSIVHPTTELSNPTISASERSENIGRVVAVGITALANVVNFLAIGVEHANLVCFGQREKYYAYRWAARSVSTRLNQRGPYSIHSETLWLAR